MIFFFGILVILVFFYYSYNKLNNKSKLTTENMNRIQNRAIKIKEFLDDNKKIPSYNSFRTYFPDTDMVEWGDIRTFTDKTSINTITKALS